MIHFGSIKKDQISSPLAQMRRVRPVSNTKGFIYMAAPLMLTSLIDAFAVIVIYLLASTQASGPELKMDPGLKLPIAKHSQTLEKGISLTVRQGKYLVEDQELNQQQIGPYLNNLNINLKKNKDQRQGHLIIQADKASEVNTLSPILVIAAQTGFENVRFAVLGE